MRAKGQAWASRHQRVPHSDGQQASPGTSFAGNSLGTSAWNSRLGGALHYPSAKAIALLSCRLRPQQKLMLVGIVGIIRNLLCFFVVKDTRVCRCIAPARKTLTLHTAARPPPPPHARHDQRLAEREVVFTSMHPRFGYSVWRRSGHSMFLQAGRCNIRRCKTSSKLKHKQPPQQQNNACLPTLRCFQSSTLNENPMLPTISSPTNPELRKHTDLHRSAESQACCRSPNGKANRNDMGTSGLRVEASRSTRGRPFGGGIDSAPRWGSCEAKKTPGYELQRGHDDDEWRFRLHGKLTRMHQI